MSKAKFTQDQVDQAVAEFFDQEPVENGSEYLDISLIPGAGNNGPITVYKGVSDGQNEIPSE